MSIPIYVFMWKNFKSKLYIWASICLNAALLCLFTCTLLYFLPKYDSSETLVFDAFSEIDLTYNFPSGYEDFVVYAPKSSRNRIIITEMRHQLNILDERVVPLDTEEEVLDFLKKSNSQSYGIVFRNGNVENILNYTIHKKHNNFRTDQLFLHNIYDVDSRTDNEYIDSGFIMLQLTIDRMFIKTLAGNQNFDFSFEHFPKLSYTKIVPNHILVYNTMFIMIFFIMLLAITLLPLVEEKEDGIKEFLKLATNYHWLNEATTIIVNFLIVMPLVLGVIAAQLYCNLFPGISVFYLIVLYVLFVVASLSYSILASAFFSSVFYCKLGGIFLYILPYIIFSLFENFATDILRLLSFSTVFLDCLEAFELYVSLGRSFTAVNLTETLVDQKYSIATLFIWLFVDSILYFFVYIYISNVFPGEYGTAKPFYYIFLPSYYRRSKMLDEKHSGLALNEVVSREGHSKEKKVAIRIKNLRKEFSSYKKKKNVAVNDINMDIVSNELTVLLGHNGAGKTTTMSMIIGIMQKTSGEISIHGLNRVNEYRQLIGYCPQIDFCMRYLNCSEHILFFGQLRGMTAENARKEASIILKKVQLGSKTKEMAYNLSGGMKRKLCLALAIIGDTKVIILDEPTSGLDPESRRELWNIFIELKKERTILMTTHYMEEADVLGDNISIMANGKILCSGTAVDLKRKYGSGYTLKVLTNKHFNHVETMKLITDKIPMARTTSFVEPTLCICLPYPQIHNYSAMLEILEENAEMLGIECLSITNSSLEEVFIQSAQEEEQKHPSVDDIDASYERIREDRDEESMQLISYKKWNLIRSQFLAVLYKKTVFIKRRALYFTMMFTIPTLVLCCTLYLFRKTPNIRPHASLDLNVNLMPETEILLTILPGTDNDWNSNFQQLFADYFANAKSKPIILRNVPNIEKYLLELESKNHTHLHERTVAAIEISDDPVNNNHKEVKILFSGNAIHSAPVALNLVTNTILKMVTNSSFAIETNNEPLIRESANEVFDLHSFAQFMPQALFIFILSFVSLPFCEEESGYKRLQSISPSIYWMSFFTIDLIIHLAQCLPLVLVHVLVNLDGRIFSNEVIAGFFISYFCYGIAYIPLIYVLCQLFNGLSHLYSLLFYICLTGNIFGIFFADAYAMETYKYLVFFLNLIPDFGLKQAINILIIYEEMIQATHVRGSPSSVSFFGRPFSSLDITHFVIIALLSAAFWLIILITFLENIYRKERCLNKVKSWLRCMDNTCLADYPEEPIDIDVQKENSKVNLIMNKNTMDKYATLTSVLRKSYQGIAAVRGISFCVNKGECFGLLGLNGAGKSSTFKMFTGYETISGGKMYMMGDDCMNHGDRVKKRFGYCPQNNCFIGYLSAYEALKYTAMTRGIPQKYINAEVKDWLRKTDLTAYADIPSRFYSGGTKRKLSTAIAMIGYPSIIFLDEPTSGVDPVSRRFIWKCIQDFQKSKRTVILTSHSMDECEFLCNRLSIMAEGKFKCIGPIQRLREKYGGGYSFIIKMKANLTAEQIETLKDRIKNSLNCELRKQHEVILQFMVADDQIVWSKVFNQINELVNQNSECIEEYSLNEISLDDIFLKLAHDMLSEVQILSC